MPTLNPSGYQQRNKTIAQRFWEKVDIGKTNECWNWTGTIARTGYGCMFIAGEGKRINKRVTRLVLELAGNPPPDEKVVMHTCDNPACVNPAHLRIGTQRDNQKDKLLKNRQAKGEGHGMAVLSEADILEIRRRHERGTSIYRLSKDYDISWTHAKRIVIKQVWSHI